jgi:hypothetical protein
MSRILSSTWLLQGLEGQVQLHAQITRGGIYCEHANVLEGTPAAFSGRVLRTRELSDYIPGKVGGWLSDG